MHSCKHASTGLLSTFTESVSTPICSTAEQDPASPAQNLGPLIRDLLTEGGPRDQAILFLAVRMLLVAMPGAASSVLAPSSKARSP